ncbi:hypothetical protein [Lactobacillus sp.]|uniref:hypothetical protein n=1 Tax=Lactobacillus sp. TaxID=1591 RepID=UPI00198EBA5A|nr:hypothetical protein [Lactobacillus sp.]MBD5430017.1 hypothetical protein [Lactobacillus sp.]MBD5430472.1 hypothetical protein [Lactobacillus sp.]
MVAGSRSELRRIDQAQNAHNKRSLVFIIFTVITLGFSLLTFMNPNFMKKQLAKESNAVVAERFVNERFDNFAETIGADRNGDTSNILTEKQTKPIANAMVDYTLGIHWFRAENASLAEKIRQVILKKIDGNSSQEAQSVKSHLKKYNNRGIYSVITGFNLSSVTLSANIETLFVVINALIIMMCLLSLFSVIRNMTTLLSKKGIVHAIMGAIMWVGALFMIIYGLLAAVPLIFNVEGLIFSIGYFLEVASGIFLELVIVGVILFVISTILWQLTTED